MLSCALRVHLYNLHVYPMCVRVTHATHIGYTCGEIAKGHFSKITETAH